MNIKINRSVSDNPYQVGLGDGMSISIISILRSDFKKRLLSVMAHKTGYLDEGEFMEKHRHQSVNERARSLALFREQAEEARREAFLETCVDGWNVNDTEGNAVPFSMEELKSLFLTDENKHQIDDLMAISSSEELFWIKAEKEATEELEK